MPYVLSTNYTQITASGTLTRPSGMSAGDLSVLVVHMVGSTSLNYSATQSGVSIFSLGNGWSNIDPGSYTLSAGRVGQHAVAYKLSESGTDNDIDITFTGLTGSPAAAKATWLYFELVDEPAPTDETYGYVTDYDGSGLTLSSPSPLTPVAWTGGLTAAAPAFEFGVISTSAGSLTSTPTGWTDTTDTLDLANSAQGDVAIVYRYRTTSYSDPDEAAFSGVPTLVTASFAGLGPIEAPSSPLSPPTAVIDATTLILLPGGTATFYGDSSTDADGTIESYEWTIEQPEGESTVTGTGISISASFSTPGSYVVTLTVTDNDDLTDSTTVTVVVGYATVTEAHASQPILIRQT